MSFLTFLRLNAKDIILLPLRVGRNFQWVGRSTEWVGLGLPGLSLKPPLVSQYAQFTCNIGRCWNEIESSLSYTERSQQNSRQKRHHNAVFLHRAKYAIACSFNTEQQPTFIYLSVCCTCMIKSIKTSRGM